MTQVRELPLLASGRQRSGVLLPAVPGLIHKSLYAWKCALKMRSLANTGLEQLKPESGFCSQSPSEMRRRASTRDTLLHIRGSFHGDEHATFEHLLHFTGLDKDLSLFYEMGGGVSGQQNCDLKSSLLLNDKGTFTRLYLFTPSD